MFGVSLSLDVASNNYAEYVGIIMAQLFSALFKRTDIDIATDSTLVVTQVKGLAKCLNARLVELIKIVHALTFKFSSMGLDYISRESNSLADALANDAARSTTF